MKEALKSFLKMIVGIFVAQKADELKKGAENEIEKRIGND